MNALFIGYGRMGSALGEAWLAAGLVDSISAVEPCASGLEHWFLRWAYAC